MATNTKAQQTWYESAVLVLILLAVGVAAGGASFTHVHDWTMRNSPASTGDWFGWANAVITELVPIAALLVMRRRRAAGQPVLYPVCLLGGALVLSVTAQLAVAKPGFSGGLVSVIPALAFAALAKLILGKGPAAEVAGEPAPAAVRDVRPRPVPVPDVRPRPQDVPVPSPTPLHVPDERPRPVPVAPAPAAPALAVEDRREHVPAMPVEVVRAVVPAPVEAIAAPSRSWPTAPLPAGVLDTARDAAARFAAEHGRQIRRDELQKILRVSNSTTGDVMAALGLTTPRTPVTAVNGTAAPGLL
ncbi:hypothetical protein [Catellatospora chokoriensis]|uniref:DUF2637 domain-containing protein n=1 Tax=Catellatospora chokoriensis TaxID=310353 RepID=A0A8J3NWH6_9ACTN|nr:hypothetical protein [Catellatospora chokoriensis]GIF94903.1 hypothetical protein Cch02nite_83470 [Catellatospora chokoriensis]